MNLNFDTVFTERTPRIVAAAKLHRKSQRDKTNTFLIEGKNSVEMALAAGKLTDVFLTEQAAQRYPQLVLRLEESPVYCHAITDRAAAKLADTVTPTGIFGLCSYVVDSFEHAQSVMSIELALVCVETRDPGNCGTLVRLADALGADLVIFAGQCADPQSAKAVRASAGSVFNVAIAECDDIDRVVAMLKEKGIRVVATALDGDVELGTTEGRAAAAPPVAWLVGNEAHGLPGSVMEQCDTTVRLPLAGRAESLNVAAAAAICLWESTQLFGRENR